MDSIANINRFVQPLDLDALHKEALRLVVKHESAHRLYHFIAMEWFAPLDVQVVYWQSIIAKYAEAHCPNCNDTRYVIVRGSIDSGPRSIEYFDYAPCPDCCCSTCGGLKDSAYCLCNPKFSDEIL